MVETASSMPGADRVEVQLDACAVAGKQLASNIPRDVCRRTYASVSLLLREMHLES